MLDMCERGHLRFELLHVQAGRRDRNLRATDTNEHVEGVVLELGVVCAKAVVSLLMLNVSLGPSSAMAVHSPCNAGTACSLALGVFTIVSMAASRRSIS